MNLNETYNVKKCSECLLRLSRHIRKIFVLREVLIFIILPIMENRNVGTRRVSGQQLDILWEYLHSHRDIAVSFNRSLQAKEHSKRKWQEVAEVLNAQGVGAHKDWKSWSKYWVDYKAKLKRRVAALRLSQRRTGGGPSTEQPLSDIENKFLQILGEDYGQGLSGVQVEPFPPSGSTTAIIGSPDILMPTQDSPASESILVRPPPPDDHTSPSKVPRTPFCDSPTAAPAAAAAVLPPRRRRRRREVLLSHEAARRALIQHSESRAQATINSSESLEGIRHTLVEIKEALTELCNIQMRIERITNAAFPRAAE